MVLKMVTERPPTYTAFRYNGGQAEVDALNAYLSDSEWSATWVDEEWCRIDGPHGTVAVDNRMVIVFVQSHGVAARAVAKFQTVADAAARFVGLVS